MQDGASSAEALVRPPFLCPVCLEKVAWGIGAVIKGWEDDNVRRAFVRERYESIRRVCERFIGESGGVFWVGYEVWLREVIAMMS
jgi:archaemetzincin